MSAWPKGKAIQYGRHYGASHFYWWCPVCEQSGVDERLSFAVTAGREHQAVVHG